jgi:hypothetical protein
MPRLPLVETTRPSWSAFGACGVIYSHGDTVATILFLRALRQPDLDFKLLKTLTRRTG